MNGEECSLVDFWRSILEYMDDLVDSNIFRIIGRMPVPSLVRNLSALVSWLETSTAMSGCLTNRMTRDQEAIVSILINSCGLVVTNPLNAHVKRFYGGENSAMSTPRFLLMHGCDLSRVFEDEYQLRQTSNVSDEETGESLPAGFSGAGANDTFSPLSGAADRETALIFPGLLDEMGTIKESFKVFGVSHNSKSGKTTVRLQFEATPADRRGTSKKNNKSWYDVGTGYETRLLAIVDQATFILEHLPEMIAAKAWIRKLRSSPGTAVAGLRLASAAHPDLHDVVLTAGDEIKVLLFVAHCGSKVAVVNTWYHVFGYSPLITRLRALGYEGKVHTPMGMTHESSAADDSEATVDLASTTMQYAGYELTSDSSLGVQLAFKVYAFSVTRNADVFI